MEFEEAEKYGQPYSPYTHAYKNQQIYAMCLNCGQELFMFREYQHQHWRPSGRAYPELVEWNGTVYLKCGACDKIVARTRLKPNTKYMPNRLKLILEERRKRLDGKQKER